VNYYKLFGLVYLLFVSLPHMEAGSSASSSLESSRRTRSETGRHLPSGTKTGMPDSVATSSSNSSRDSCRLVPKEGKKSPLWRYSSLKVREDGRPIDNGQVYCRMCPMNVWKHFQSIFSPGE